MRKIKKKLTEVQITVESGYKSFSQTSYLHYFTLFLHKSYDYIDVSDCHYTIRVSLEHLFVGGESDSGTQNHPFTVQTCNTRGHLSAMKPSFFLFVYIFFHFFFLIFFFNFNSRNAV